MPDDYLTKSQVAQLLQVSERTVDLWVRKGWLPRIKLGTGRNATVRFPKEALKAKLTEYTC